MSLVEKKGCDTPACCCVDVGTVIDEKDCQVKYAATFAQQDEALKMQTYLMAKAKGIETDPCLITSQITPETDGLKLSMEFTFCCAAEALIFQLAMR